MHKAFGGQVAVAVLGGEVVVAVGIAVDEEVVGAADAVEADGLAVVHAERREA
jgi:hypothetical protein